MTCIVGIETSDGVIIGGDSAGTGGYSQTIRADQKVWNCGENDEWVYGFTSSFRMGQLLRYTLTAPLSRYEVDRDDQEAQYKWMSTDFIDAVRKCLKSGGYAKIDSGVEEGGCFLVGWRGTLYVIESDFQVGRSVDGFNAVGSGQDLALGALHATRQPKDMPAAERVSMALDAAATYNAAVAEPFHLVSGASPKQEEAR